MNSLVAVSRQIVSRFRSEEEIPDMDFGQIEPDYIDAERDAVAARQQFYHQKAKEFADAERKAARLKRQCEKLADMAAKDMLQLAAYHE